MTGAREAPERDGGPGEPTRCPPTIVSPPLAHTHTRTLGCSSGSGRRAAGGGGGRGGRGDRPPRGPLGAGLRGSASRSAGSKPDSPHPVSVDACGRLLHLCVWSCGSWGAAGDPLGALSPVCGDRGRPRGPAGIFCSSPMNPGNPPPYSGPGPTAPYPPYPQPPMGPEAYPPGPMGGPYPPPQGYPYQGYPQYGWQGGPQEPPKTTVYVVEDQRRDDLGASSCLTACWTALCCCCLWDMLT